jgi:hypothetical protein
MMAAMLLSRFPARWRACLGTLVVSALVALPVARTSAAEEAAPSFEKDVVPILENYCYDCHADGVNKGKVALDAPANDALLHNHDLWLKVLKNVRAGIMPPAKKDRPSADELKTLERWVKYGAFGINPADPDPGRVTLRRLNRVEYRNTIRDLTGVDFKADEEFPPDDTGYGFDNIGDVLTVSPLLLEKYMEAAEKIVAEAVPLVPKVVREDSIPGARFRVVEHADEEKADAEGQEKDKAGDTDKPREGRRGRRGEQQNLSFYKPWTLSTDYKVDTAGTYELTLDVNIRGEFDFDPGRAWAVFRCGDEVLLSQEFGWNNGKTFKFDFEQKWEPGTKTLTLELEPLVPSEQRKGGVDMRVNAVAVKGPLEPEHWVRPKNFDRFFTKDAPTDPTERRQYARETLERFARKAFRRPVDEKTIDRLASIAEDAYSAPGKRFEDGIARAFVAILASPRFVFRVEAPQASAPASEPFPNVDEYALASRLSYFLWSSMPDEELTKLAEKGELRKNLDAQVKRMLADRKSEAFLQNFPGQWLQVRDVDGISIDERSVLARDSGDDKQMARDQEERRALFAKIEKLPEAERQKEFEKLRGQFRNRRRFGPPAVQLDGELRRAMRRETEMSFEYVVREDRSVLDLIDSDYTFLNEKLAKHYGIDGVKGNEMRKVELPKDSPRGGVLTQGSVLVVTSNPTRTSPVKRGLFVLDNLLGLPTPPPPADIPAFEESDKASNDHAPTTREILQIHRENALCRSCHARMDPLGLALENFNALGMWRETERKQPLDVAGQLVSGEKFTGIRELKQILKTTRKDDFYHCLAEKVLTYALGRGPEYYDVEAIDRIVDRMKQNDGRFSAVVMGVIESAPFQKQRRANPGANGPAAPAQASATSSTTE